MLTANSETHLKFKGNVPEKEKRLIGIILEWQGEVKKQRKILQEYKNLCNRILNPKCQSLEHARGMIKIFNHYTKRGTQKFSLKVPMSKAQHKRIYGD